MREVKMDTKPTSTLAKLYVSQEKYDYALAIYLYLQAKEGKKYHAEITEAMTAICETHWGDYDRQIKKIFSKEEIAKLHIVPEDLRVATTETLNDIENDFEGTMPKLAEDVLEDTKVETPEIEEIEEPEVEPVSEIIEEKEPETLTESQPEPDEIEPETASGETEEEIEPDESDEEIEEIEFPTLGDTVYEEPEIAEPEPKADIPANEEDLVPGLDEFTNNYKKEVTKGLSENNNVSDDEGVEKKLQDDIDQKLFSVLRILRGMSADELRRILYKKLNEGAKLEELTLGDLEELLD
jgi:hypothetical protein